MQALAAGDPALLVLGPLTLQGDAGEVRLGGAKPRRLLAALALTGGQMVPADRLIDVAWGDSPPRTARQNLHTYLWSLRRSLAAATGRRLVIQVQPPGYLLRIAPSDLDWHIFRELCSAAARCASSDPAAAGQLLHEALAAFHQLREQLTDELGVDPSPKLHRLYEAMLRADATLDCPGQRAYAPDHRAALAASSLP